MCGEKSGTPIAPFPSLEPVKGPKQPASVLTLALQKIEQGALPSIHRI